MQRNPANGFYIAAQGPMVMRILEEARGGQGIEAVSLNPDTVVETWLYLAGKNG